MDAAGSKVTVLHEQEGALFEGGRLRDAPGAVRFEARLDLTRRAEREVRCPGCGRAIPVSVYPGLPFGRAVRATVREIGVASALVQTVPFLVSLAVLVAIAILGAGKYLSESQASSLGSVFLVVWLGACVMFFVGMGSTVSGHMRPGCRVPAGHSVRHEGRSLSDASRLDLREPFYGGE